VAELCAAAGKPAKAVKTAPTFRELGEAWTSGKLHKLYPDQVPLKDTAVDDASRLDRYAYPVIGAKPVDQVTLDDCEQIMRSIPESAQRSRRHIAGTIARVFRMAVYPCRHISASPLPKGFLPRANSRKALTYLYPENDRALLTCPAVPFGYRLLWGFLAREGMREGEALGLTWNAVDLARSMVRLDENKTDDPRAWALDPGVARALRVYRKPFAPDAEGDDPVFVQRSKFGLAETFRTHLERAGVKAERPELFVTTASRQQIRVHDLRGTFVTLALANGRPESWVMPRTGHRSSQMVNRYRRIATSFAELNLGELAPLNQAILELAQLALQGKVGLGLGQPDSNEGAKSMYSETKNAASPTGFEPVLQP
jgi:integrase